METPLWYRIHQHQIDLNEFLRRYNRPDIYSEKDVLPIFLLMLLRQRNFYTDKGHHLLFEFFAERGITERGLMYIYIYQTWGYNLEEESIFSGESMTFQQYKYSLTNDFDHDYIIQWIVLIVRGMLGLRVVGPSVRDYTRDTDQNITQQAEDLKQALAYKELLDRRRMVLPEITVEKLFKLSQAERALADLKLFFEGKFCPKYLEICRSDSDYFQILVQQYWPAVLKSFSLLRPWTPEETTYLQQEHQKLSSAADIGFFLDYVESFRTFFPLTATTRHVSSTATTRHVSSTATTRHVSSTATTRHVPLTSDSLTTETSKEEDEHTKNPLTEQLLEMSQPCPKKDYLRMKQHLMALSPEERQKILPFRTPLSDHNVAVLTNLVRLDGFNTCFKQWIQQYRKSTMEEWDLIGTSICNETIVSSSELIWAYPPDELVFCFEGKNGYVFTRSELFGLREDRKNPYNRSILPDDILEQGCPDESLNYAEIWSTILRRSVAIDDLFPK